MRSEVSLAFSFSQLIGLARSVPLLQNLKINQLIRTNAVKALARTLAVGHILFIYFFKLVAASCPKYIWSMQSLKELIFP